MELKSSHNAVVYDFASNRQLSRRIRSANARPAETKLQPFEEEIYKKAIKRGYMVVDERVHANLWDVWHKAASAQGIRLLVLVKHPEQGEGSIFCENKLVYRGELLSAKKEIKNFLL